MIGCTGADGVTMRKAARGPGLRVVWVDRDKGNMAVINSLFIETSEESDESHTLP